MIEHEAEEPYPDFQDIAEATFEEYNGIITPEILAHELAMAYESGEQRQKDLTRLRYEECWVCKAALIPDYTDGPPHCIDCYVDDDLLIDWQEHYASHEEKEEQDRKAVDPVSEGGTEPGAARTDREDGEPSS